MTKDGKAPRRGGARARAEAPAARGARAARLIGRAARASPGRRKDQFLSLAAHELRTPLTALGLHLDSVLRSGRRAGEPDLPVALRGRLEAARRQVNRMAFLIDELLDMTQLRDGRLALVTEPVDLAEVAREVAARRVREAAAAGCALTVRTEAPVPGRWDRGRLALVATHLLDNALEWGRGRPVSVEVTRQAAEARLVVADQGCGIPAEQQARIFRRYTRAAGGRRGLGLGLWVARELVERMGGVIALESRPGAGARFEVRLPTAGGG